MRVSTIVAALVFTLISSVSVAYPAFGDQVSFVGVTKNANGTESKLRLNWHITEFNRYTPDLNSLPVLWTYTHGETQKQSEKYLLKWKMWTKSKVQKQLQSCAARGGKLERLQTLIGAFKTCRIAIKQKSQTVTYWIADVPFGIARIESQNKSGRKTSLILEQAVSGSESRKR